MQVAIGLAANAVIADTAANPGTIPIRGPAGELVGAQMQGTELKSTAIETGANAPTKTGAYSISATDSTHFFCDATSAAFAITLPAVAISAGRKLKIKKVDSSANAVTVTASTGLIDGAGTKSLATQYKFVVLYCDGSNWFIFGSN